MVGPPWDLTFMFTTTDDIRSEELLEAARREAGVPRLMVQPTRAYTRPPLAPNPWAVACPSCGALAHVGCNGVVSPNAVHAWRLVDATAEGWTY